MFFSRSKGFSSRPSRSSTRILEGKAGREVLVASEEGAQPAKPSRNRMTGPNGRDRKTRRTHREIRRRGNEVGLRTLLCTQLHRLKKTWLCSSLFSPISH